jgi:hypothetical protein
VGLTPEVTFFYCHGHGRSPSIESAQVGDVVAPAHVGLRGAKILINQTQFRG